MVILVGRPNYTWFSFFFQIKVRICTFSQSRQRSISKNLQFLRTILSRKVLIFICWRRFQVSIVVLLIWWCKFWIWIYMQRICVNFHTYISRSVIELIFYFQAWFFCLYLFKTHLMFYRHLMFSRCNTPLRTTSTFSSSLPYSSYLLFINHCHVPSFRRGFWWWILYFLNTFVCFLLGYRCWLCILLVRLCRHKFHLAAFFHSRCWVFILYVLKDTRTDLLVIFLSLSLIHTYCII